MVQPQQHIFLTGFMGSGKSTLGKKLSAILKCNFIDLDHYIEQREKKTISFIFDYEGEETFRELETRCLEEILNATRPCVVALGGGTICFGENLSLVKNRGLLVYIELTAEILAYRLKNSQQKRPLLKKLIGEDLLKHIAEKLKQRESFYKQAHLIVNGLKLTPQILHQKILEHTKENSAH